MFNGNFHVLSNKIATLLIEMHLNVIYNLLTLAAMKFMISLRKKELNIH